MKAIEDRILEALEAGPMTPQDLVGKLSISWPTAQGYLLKLTGEGKLIHTRKGRVNVFLLKRTRNLRFPVPSHVKAKSLSELTKELEDYFGKVTASEMARMERREY